MWHYAVVKVFYSLGAAFAKATWTKAAALTAIWNSRFIVTARADNPQKAILNNPASQIPPQLFKHTVGDGAAFSFAVSNKSLNVRRYRLIEDRLFRTASPIRVLCCCRSFAHAANIAELLSKPRATWEMSVAS